MHNGLSALGVRQDAGVVLLMLLATLWGVVQLAVLASLTRSLRIGTILLAVAVGCYACGTSALVLEHAWTRAWAAATGQPLVLVVRRASYTVDPVIEEVAKVLPLLALVVLGRHRRTQWGLTDHVVVGAALGAGFSFLEAVLELGGRASRAVPVDGGYTMGISILSAVHIPGTGAILRSWLPAPFADAGLLGLESDLPVDVHLAWTALAAAGVGVLVRVRGPRRWVGVLPMVYACVDHAANNYDLRFPDHGGLVVGALTALHEALWLWPLLVLVAAVLLDRRVLRRAAGRDVELLIPDERRRGAPTSGGLLRTTWLAPPWTVLLVWRFVLLRRSVRYSQARPTRLTPAFREAGIEVARAVGRKADRAVWRAARPQLRPNRQLVRQWRLWVWVTLLVPVLLYYGVGAVPVFSAVQRWLARPAVTAVIAVIVAASVLWTGRQGLLLLRRLRVARRDPWSEPLVRLSLRLLVALGSAVMAVVLLAAWALGVRNGAASLAPTFHVLEALGDALMVAALVLALMAMFLFPPLALVAVEGAGGVVALTVSAELVAALGASAVLWSGGHLLNEVGQDSSSPGSSSSGGRPPTREERLDELARDPADGGRISDGTRREAEVGLEMEERGSMPGPIRRSSDPRAEFVDAAGVKWDVKGFRSEVPGRRGGFRVDEALKNIHKKTDQGTRVIIDPSRMSSDDVAALHAAVDDDPLLASMVEWL